MAEKKTAPRKPVPGDERSFTDRLIAEAHPSWGIDELTLAEAERSWASYVEELERSTDAELERPGRSGYTKAEWLEHVTELNRRKAVYAWETATGRLKDWTPVGDIRTHSERTLAIDAQRATIGLLIQQEITGIERAPNREEAHDLAAQVTQELHHDLPENLFELACDRVRQLFENVDDPAHVQRVTSLAMLAIRSIEAEYLRASLDGLVEEARVLGASWSEVASAVGIAQQSAYQRWSTKGKESYRARRRPTPADQT